MKPQSCRNCGKEIFQNQRVCPKCGRDTEQDDPEWIKIISEIIQKAVKETSNPKFVQSVDSN
jgi:uncharacterized OB-fold protein